MMLFGKPCYTCGKNNEKKNKLSFSRSNKVLLLKTIVFKFAYFREEFLINLISTQLLCY